MNREKETIAVDANPIISSLLGGRARIVLFSRQFESITTEHTTWDVKKYVPQFSARTDIPEKELHQNLVRMPIVAKTSLRV